MKSLFHMAYNVTDLAKTKAFYSEVLGCTEGRSTETWVDYNFFGHQISMHLGEPFKVAYTGKVGEHMVAMPHLGVVLELTDWEILAQRLEDAGVKFIIPPTARFVGEAGEQHTMFFTDPSDNPIEIKGFKNFDMVFECKEKVADYELEKKLAAAEKLSGMFTGMFPEHVNIQWIKANSDN